MIENDRKVTLLQIRAYKETHLNTFWGFQANLKLPLEFTVNQLPSLMEIHY